MATTPSSYLRYLPELFRHGPTGESSPFLGEFLKIFEALLSGRPDAFDATGIRGLEELVERFPEYVDPALAPVDDPDADPGVPLRSEFLDYLASWAALVLDQNWDLEKKREWARRIMPLYKRRGTRDGLQDYLKTFVGNQVYIDEPPGGFTLAAPVGSTLGVDTFLAGAPAYYFRVRIEYAFDPLEPFDLTRWINIHRGTRAIVDREKPAHTYYTLDTRTPGFVLARPGHTVLGRETLIWRNSSPA